MKCLEMRKTSFYFTMDRMATYAIGDVQGCADSLAALVQRLSFRPQRDRLWFVGDLVNRGPKSAEVLRMIRAAGPSAQVVLGNHDFHLLAMASGARPVQASDTVSALLDEPDAQELIDWLRQQPLCVADGPTHGSCRAASRVEQSAGPWVLRRGLETAAIGSMEGFYAVHLWQQRGPVAREPARLCALSNDCERHDPYALPAARWAA